MSIDTEITGSPGSIRGAARWLGGTLKPAVARGSEAMVGARRTASADWGGATSAAFCGAMGRGVSGVDDLEASVGGVRSAFDDYAGSLESCQNRMTAIRQDALGAGLTLSGLVVQEPTGGPSNPGGPPTEPTPTQADAYDADVAAWNAHQEKVLAYNRLMDRAVEVWTDLERAWERVSAKDHGPSSFEWGLNIGAIAGGVVVAGMQYGASSLASSAAAARQIADYELDQARRYGHLMGEDNYARRMQNAGSYGNAADDLDGRSNGLTRGSRLLNRGLGAAGFGLGVYNDLQNGESVEQAVVSNGVGLGASVLTGMAVGTAVGGPVGTVAGAVVGTVVGLAASEFADGLYETGGDVLDSALQAGDALVDAGSDAVDAVGDAAGAIADGIGSLF